MNADEGKPMYERGTCPVCQTWKENQSGHTRPLCNSCQKEIPEYPKYVSSGYQAVSVDHWHIRMMGSAMGKTCIKQTLCKECYCIDYQKNYPDEVCPL